MDPIVAATRRANRRATAFQKLQNRLTAADDNNPQFPIPFDAPGVRRQATQVEAARALLSDQLHHQQCGDTSFDDVFEVNEEEGRDFDSLKNEKLGEGETQTIYSTPMKRDRGSFQASKAWLLGWLIYAGMLNCHISHTPPHAHLLLQVAHILIPNAMNTNNPLLTLYEWILGMDYRSLCKHSRLFLMPLMNSLHCRLDDDLYIILPSKELLGRMLLYFSAVNTRRTGKAKNKHENMWALLRDGKLLGHGNAFRDGSIYPFFLVPHPFAHVDVQEGLAYPGLFYSHTSPFAVLLKTFRTLHVWSTPTVTTPRGYNEPEGDFDRSNLLTAALRVVQLEEEDIDSIVSAVNEIYEVIQSLLSHLDKEGPAWVNVKKPPSDDSGGSTRRSRHSNEDPKDHAGARNLNSQGLNSCIEKNGLSGLQFTGSRNVSNNLMHEPYDGMSFFLHDILVGSVRSDASWEGGTVTDEPGFHSSSEGPSPAQEIANRWRQAQSHSVAPVPSVHSIQTRSSHTIIGDRQTLDKLYRAANKILSPPLLLKGVDARIRTEAFRVLAKLNVIL